MARSVLEIVSDAVDVIGVEPIQALVNNTDPGARTMLALFNQAGNVLTRMRNSWGASWAVLTVPWTFQTAANEDTYTLPNDYQSLVGETLWAADAFERARGSLSPQQWAQLQSGIDNWFGERPLYRVRKILTGSTIQIEPVPADANRITLEYVSNAWMTNPDRSERFSRVKADTDIPLLDDMLLQMDVMWRFKQSRGLPFATELAEFEMERDRRLADDAGTAVISIGYDDRTRRTNVPVGSWPLS